jgi:hypothetical protein
MKGLLGTIVAVTVLALGVSAGPAHAQVTVPPSGLTLESLQECEVAKKRVKQARKKEARKATIRSLKRDRYTACTPLRAAKAEYERAVKAEPELARALTSPGKKSIPLALDYADGIVTDVFSPLPGLVIQRGTGVDTGTRYMNIYAVNPACDCVMGADISDADRAEAGAGPLDDITQFRTNGTDRGYPIYEAFDPTPGIEEWVRIA